MGLTASIYKDARIGPCSNGGISERFDQVLIVNAEGPSEPRDDMPCVMVVDGNLPGCVKAVPVQPTPDGGWEVDATASIGPMFGGCFIHTSDSRFSELTAEISGSRGVGAVPLHDRFETQEQYDALSR